MVQDLVINERLVIPAAALQWRFSRASGPGGQGVNTTDSRVELVLDVANCACLGPINLGGTYHNLDFTSITDCQRLLCSCTT